MIFSCETKTLSDAISTVMKAASNKSNLPILEGLLISTDEDCLIVTANNMELGIECRIPATIKEDGAFVTGDARVFFEIIRKLPAGTADIHVNENYSTTIQSGKAIYNILGLSPESYPELPFVETDAVLHIAADKLRSMLRQTIYAAAIKHEKPMLTGAFFEIEEGVFSIVALDGFRMAIRTEKMKTEDEGYGFIVPSKALSELCRILPEDDTRVSLRLTDKHLLFSFDNKKVISRLIAGEYFNYKGILPKEHTLSLRLKVDDILSSVGRADPIVAMDVYRNPVIITVADNTLSIDCVTAVGKAHDVIEIAETDQTIRIGFNQKYLHDALANCECSDIIMEFNTNKSPCMIRPAEGEDFLFMVLPVRISEA